MSKYSVIVPNDVKPKPERHEIEAAGIVGNHFKSDVKFLKRGPNKSADIMVISTNVRWEMKSPTGQGKRNIQHQLQYAMKQSQNIVFDAARSKIHIAKIKRELGRQYTMTRGMKRLLLITKDKKVVVFNK